MALAQVAHDGTQPSGIPFNSECCEIIQRQIFVAKTLFQDAKNLNESHLETSDSGLAIYLVQQTLTFLKCVEDSRTSSWKSC